MTLIVSAFFAFSAAACSARQGLSDPAEFKKIELLMNSLEISSKDRPVVAAALELTLQVSALSTVIQQRIYMLPKWLSKTLILKQNGSYKKEPLFYG